MEAKTIVAIEIASSKIKGAVGRVSADGRIAMLDIEETRAINNVRYGRVQNIREVTDAIADIISRLEASPEVAPAKICGVVVSIGGRSVMGAPAQASLRFATECEITDKLVERLKFEATRDYVGDRLIIDILPRVYYVNNKASKKAVGTFAETLRGVFTMVTCGKETRQSLDRIKLPGIEPQHIHYQLRATAIADFILTPEEREVGCAMVDFGAETCTVAIYRDGSLAFLSTLPMGSRLITLDIMSGLGVTEVAAENFKTTLATMGDDTGGGINAREIKGYVRARAGEIAANIQNQITRSGITDDKTKIVLTGGGSRLPEFASQLSKLTKLPVRVAEMPQIVSFSNPDCNNADNIDVVSLIWAGRNLPADECVPNVEAAAAAVANDTIADTPEVVETIAEQTLFPPEDEIQPEEEEEEEDVLVDDPDEVEEEQPRRGGLSRLFGGGKKKEKPAPEPEPEPEPEEEEPEEEPEDDEPEEEEEPKVRRNRPDGNGNFKNIIGGLKKSFVDFFATPEEDDDDDLEDEE